MQKNVRFFVLSAKDESGAIVSDYDIFSLLSTFKNKINENVELIRKEIEGRSIRCLPPKMVSKDLKQIVISFGRRKNEDLYHENPDKIDMTMVDEKIYDMNTLFYSGVHKVGFITLDRNGPSYLAIAKYLSIFSEYNICITPVVKSRTISEIRNAKKAREFGFELYLNDTLMEMVNQDNKDSKKKGVLGSLLPGVVKEKNDLNCSVMKVNFCFDGSDKKSTLNMSTILTILEEVDMSQDFIKDFYVSGAKSENERVEKMSIKKDNLYVNYSFHLDENQKFDSEYLRENGQNALQACINDVSEFTELYFR